MDGSIGKSMGWFFQKPDILKVNKVLHWEQNPQPSFNKQFDLLVAHLNANHKKGWIVPLLF